MKPITRRELVMVSGGLFLSSIVLGGCREDEQGRVLWFEKGDYLGKPDTRLSDRQVEDLRSRAQSQKF